MQQLNYRFYYVFVISMVISTTGICGAGESAGCMIRISGKIVEQVSQKPLKQAQIIVRNGNMVLASGHTTKDGSFVLYIPPEKLTNNFFDLKIVYMKHVFMQYDILAVSQNYFVEINGSLLLKDEFFDEHKLPIHSLHENQVGKITIKSPDYRIDPNAISNDPKNLLGI